MTQNSDLPPEDMPVDRRRALKRLGLAAGAAYLAPTLLSLNAAAAQEESSSPTSGGPGWNQPSKPTKPTKPKKDK